MQCTQYTFLHIGQLSLRFAGSQAKRNEPGYSDCSSFVAKSVLAAGVKPCGWSGTGNAPTTVNGDRNVITTQDGTKLCWNAETGVYDSTCGGQP